MRSFRTKQRISLILTYAFLLLVSATILFPVMVTISSAFKPGNTIAFTLNLNTQLTLNNFIKLLRN